jgi:hypothetical protein
VLVGRDGVGRISDFGLSQGNLSPPRAATRTGDEDRTLDIHAMGISAWVALSGAAELSPALAALVCRACSEDPSARFQSAREMACAIEQIEGPQQRIATASEVSTYVDSLLAEELASRRSSLPPSAGGSLVELPRPGHAPDVDADQDPTFTSRAEAIGRPELAAGLRVAGKTARRIAALLVVLAATLLCLGGSDTRPTAAAGAPSPGAITSPAPPRLMEAPAPPTARSPF